MAVKRAAAVRKRIPPLFERVKTEPVVVFGTHALPAADCDGGEIVGKGGVAGFADGADREFQEFAGGGGARGKKLWNIRWNEALAAWLRATVKSVGVEEKRVARGKRGIEFHRAADRSFPAVVSFRIGCPNRRGILRYGRFSAFGRVDAIEKRCDANGRRGGRQRFGGASRSHDEERRMPGEATAARPFRVEVKRTRPS